MVNHLWLEQILDLCLCRRIACQVPGYCKDAKLVRFKTVRSLNRLIFVSFGPFKNRWSTQSLHGLELCINLLYRVEEVSTL